jgi:hypothetical protein
VNNILNGDDALTQMPADFLIDASNGVVLAVKYGTRMDDRWTADEVSIISYGDLLGYQDEKGDQIERSPAIIYLVLPHHLSFLHLYHLSNPFSGQHLSSS